MAPLAITIRNSNVMIPVMLYKMLIATAVVGGGPPGVVSLVTVELLELLKDMRAASEPFGFKALSRTLESPDEIMV
jgi:hypothetical protein